MTRFHLVQTNLSWEDPQQNRRSLGGKVADLSSGLIVLPEMFNTGFSMASEHLAEPMSGPTVSWMQTIANEQRVSICGSLIVEASGAYYNRFVFVRPDDKPLIYNKRHLFRMAQEHTFYQPGKETLLVNLGDITFQPQICYDLRFPVWSRNQNQYDLLIYVANWPAARRDHWLSLLKARAIENQCYVIGVNRIGKDGNDVNYTGDSCVMDYNGDYLLQMNDDDAIESIELNIKALQQYREKFPAYLDSDNFRITD